MCFLAEINDRNSENVDDDDAADVFITACR